MDDGLSIVSNDRPLSLSCYQSLNHSIGIKLQIDLSCSPRSAILVYIHLGFVVFEYFQVLKLLFVLNEQVVSNERIPKAV